MSTAIQEIHIDDYGTIFRATILDGGTIVDISSTNNKEFTFQKPDASSLAVSGVFLTDGTDGIMQYTTVDGDLNQAGNWQIQGKVFFTSSVWNTSIHKFKVHDNL